MQNSAKTPANVTYQVTYNETIITTMEMHGEPDSTITIQKFRTYSNKKMALSNVECLKHVELDDVRWSNVRLFKIVREPGKRTRRYEIAVGF